VPWLTRDAVVLASVATAPGGDPATGVVLRRRPLVVRVGGVDVAWCRPVATDGGDETVVVRRLASGRMPWMAEPGLWAPVVITARAGTFERWRLCVGDLLAITGD
jgi:hypothetical protein